MKNIQFSVLMSVYINDNAKYVEIAINSLLEQSLLPNQIVIMVDGPITRELELLLGKYENNSLFDIYYRKNNLGLGLTLNDGIKYCKYDYIARMDADDVSLTNRFEKQILCLNDNKNLDVIGSNIDEFDEEMNLKIATRCVPEKDYEIKKKLKERNPINHVTALYRKKKVLSVNGYEDYPYFEDYYLWAKLIKSNASFYNIQESLVNVRTGYSMYERRGGLKYIKNIKKFENELLNLKLINHFEYTLNMFKRCGGAVLPNKVRGFLYKKILRK